MNINDKPLSFEVSGKQVNSFNSLEAARKAAIGHEGNEVIVESTKAGVFDYKGESTFTVHEVTAVPANQIKDKLKVNDLAKGMNAVEFVFDKGNDASKTQDEVYSIKDNTLSLQKNVGNVFAFNTSELGKGTIRVVKNDAETFAFALQIKENPDIAGLSSVQNGVKDFLKGFIEKNTFADGDEDDEKMLKNQLNHYLELSVDKSFQTGHFPEINIALTKQPDGTQNMSLLTDWPIAGFTDKEIDKLKISSNNEGKTVIPLGNVKITTDLDKAKDNPSLALELLTKSYKPIDIPLKKVDNSYYLDPMKMSSKTESVFDSLRKDRLVEIGAGFTTIGNSRPEAMVSGVFKKDFKDYAAIKFNYGAQVDVLPSSGRLQVTPTLGANITAPKYYGVPVSLNVDVGPSFGNMNDEKNFSMGIRTGVGAKVNITDKIDVGVNYGHVFGIKNPSQNTVGLSIGFKF
jgi:hypothetical protein